MWFNRVLFPEQGGASIYSSSETSSFVKNMTHQYKVIVLYASDDFLYEFVAHKQGVSMTV